MSGGAAIDFVPEAFSMDAVAPMGRQAAGEGFLAAWAKWSGRDRFVGHVRDEAAGAAFVRRMGELAPERTAVSCSSTAPAALAQEGVLFAFRPELSQHRLAAALGRINALQPVRPDPIPCPATSPWSGDLPHDSASWSLGTP